MKKLQACVLALALCAPGANAADRYLHQLDTATTVKPYLSPQGMLDPAFPPTIAKPSPYLGDFFGIQAIADVPRDKILADFVPRYARVASNDANSVTLDFTDGYSATFYPEASVGLKDIAVPVAHVVFSGDDWRTKKAHIAAFYALLARTKLTGAYLLPNKLQGAEKIVQEQQAHGKPAEVRTDPDLKLFDATQDAVLLFPEAVHGIPKDAERLSDMLAQHKADWLGMEMLNQPQQADLDAFNAAKEGTPAYDAARAKLVAYFAASWNGRAGPKTTGEENYYFKLAETAHRNGTHLIALEGAPLDYILFRYGETSFGGAVRSYLWAMNAPRTGRGVIFGGGAHFDAKAPINAQDFLVARDHSRPIVSLRAKTPS